MTTTLISPTPAPRTLSEFEECVVGLRVEREITRAAELLREAVWSAFGGKRYMDLSMGELHQVEGHLEAVLVVIKVSLDRGREATAHEHGIWIDQMEAKRLGIPLSVLNEYLRGLPPAKGPAPAEPTPQAPCPCPSPGGSQ